MFGLHSGLTLIPTVSHLIRPSDTKNSPEAPNNTYERYPIQRFTPPEIQLRPPKSNPVNMHFSLPQLSILVAADVRRL
jgi:hypothetical protein